MSHIYNFKDSFMIIADYSSPEYHKHLAFHIIISLGGNMKWNIEDEEVNCRGICINSDVLHTGQMPEEGAVVLLFTKTSSYAESVNKEFLNGRKYYVFNNEVINKICEKYNKLKEVIEIQNPKAEKQIDYNTLYKEVINAFDLKKDEPQDRFDGRVCEILSYVHKEKTIKSTIVDDLSQHIFLSKSRMSHIFKEQTGMSLHSYIAAEKLHKAFDYINQGLNITEASMAAGFDSPSHCASTCRRMFGISFRNLYKTVK